MTAFRLTKALLIHWNCQRRIGGIANGAKLRADEATQRLLRVTERVEMALDMDVIDAKEFDL